MGQRRENAKTAEQLYKELGELLAGMETGGRPADGYSGQIGLVSEKLIELSTIRSSFFTDTETEVDYFARVWPQFYSKLYYYLLLHHFWMRRLSIRAAQLPALILQEEERIARFFCQHQKFWSYYRCNPPAIAGQFTRAYSRSCIFDPMIYVLDPEGVTLASHLAAKGLAYEAYRVWLEQAEEKDSFVVSRRFTWNESKSAAVELIKSQAEAGSVSIDGIPATAAQLTADFEEKYDLDLENFDNLLYATDTRKTGDTPYLMKLVNAFLGRK
jgi:hypothetical protein